jgi:serine/threonine-protein kinase RsbW
LNKSIIKPTFEYSSSYFTHRNIENYFQSMDKSTQSLRLTSCPQTVSQVVNYVEKLSQSLRLSADKHFDVVTCVTEAVNNAIVHGNCRDEKKTVNISIRKEKDVVAVHVTDEGKGFDFRSLPDPTSPEYIEKVGGRGVFIMRQLSHNLQFRNNGTTVEMQFKIK